MEQLISSGDGPELFGSDSTATTPTVPMSRNDDLQQRVRLFLAGSNLPGLRHVDVEVQGDTVILRGNIRTFYEKQLAARLSRRVAGVIHVIDLIEVRGYVPRVDAGRLHYWRENRDSRRPR